MVALSLALGSHVCVSVPKKEMEEKRIGKRLRLVAERSVSVTDSLPPFVLTLLRLCDAWPLLELDCWTVIASVRCVENFRSKVISTLFVQLARWLLLLLR
jgi:hypothetical protein